MFAMAEFNGQRLERGVLINLSTCSMLPLFKGYSKSVLCTVCILCDTIIIGLTVMLYF